MESSLVQFRFGGSGPPRFAVKEKSAAGAALIADAVSAVAFPTSCDEDLRHAHFIQLPRGSVAEWGDGQRLEAAYGDVWLPAMLTPGATLRLSQREATCVFLRGDGVRAIRRDASRWVCLESGTEWKDGGLSVMGPEAHTEQLRSTRRLLTTQCRRNRTRYPKGSLYKDEHITYRPAGREVEDANDKGDTCIDHPLLQPWCAPSECKHFEKEVQLLVKDTTYRGRGAE